MQTYQVQEIYRRNGLVLSLISASSISVDLLHSKSISSCYARIEPVWLLICQAQETLALNMQAEPVDIDELYEVIPELRDVLREKQ